MRLVAGVLDLIAETEGKLNFNDALLVVLKRNGAFDDLASFDAGFDEIAGFNRLI